MPTYVFWGEDDFALNQAVQALKQKTLNADWASFNFERILPDHPDPTRTALTQAMTPPFGMGQRFVWLVDPAFFQQCPEEITQELGRSLPQIPDTTVLVLTHRSKPNGRLKATKLLQKHAEFREFSLIPPWKTEQITERVREAAQAVGVKLTRASGEYLVEAVGNNTRQLHNELEKLRLYASSQAGGGSAGHGPAGHGSAGHGPAGRRQTGDGDGDRQAPLELETVAKLITTSTQSSLQLAGAIRQGNVSKALELVADLLGRNEPPLRISATLVGQFRTWLWVKVMLESGERDNKVIASAAGVGNPNRIYFLQKEISHLNQRQLLRSLPLLLELEAHLKSGKNPEATLQTKVIELCQLFSR